ncbi:MAG: SDR family oxidoreductase [Acidobacteria bacterium]|nr:SDR family oxidoreductase [Acidobacteriota bacterium]NIM60447.1 SDR family oxidoreductase [Acidobacteriota bacterium]NIO59665.1 SDR family oxidoreductase [Acidobacteriota bacterium]NIQ30759.1 SDR family oxidoreductase [Acidobacteriota bacterium]NIQ84384.1 SDR family oxidoreductase [Acidobacteriota bacterium]
MSEHPVVLLTGGSRGLGLALLRGLLAEHYRVACVNRSTSTELDALIEANPAACAYVPGDMADPKSLEDAVSHIEKDIGPIDALVNNAGIARDSVLPTMRPAHIDELLTVNLSGTLKLTRLVTRQMVRRSRGRLVTISSIVGLRGYAGLAAYGATKAGLDGMTRALARELGPRNIRVNSIAPGYLETEMSENLGETQREQIIRRTPLGRLGKPEDVVGALLFLLSPASDFVTGQTLVVDGGIIS